MLADWREYAQRKEWQKIEIFKLSASAQTELLDMLRQVVPRRLRGHGIETFEGFIPPREARSPEEYEAARLLEWIERRQSTEEVMANYDRPLAEAVNLAIATLEEELVVRYEGFRSTYLYWHPCRGRWVQLPSKVGAAIQSRRKTMNLDPRLSGLPEADLMDALREIAKWERKYPWRTCESLWQLFKFEAFEPNTPHWHSLIILDWYEEVEGIYKNNRNLGHLNRFEALEFVRDAARSGFQIGRSYEALLKKPAEPHALRGAKSLQSAFSGADARRGKFESHTQQVLTSMEQLIESGHSISNAARLSAARGIGKSEGANRAIWHRHKPKKL